MPGYYRVSEFAKLKNVSPQAVRKRLNELNIEIIGGYTFIKKDAKAKKFKINLNMKR